MSERVSMSGSCVGESVHERQLCWREQHPGVTVVSERVSMSGSCVRESVHEWQLCWRECP